MSAYTDSMFKNIKPGFDDQNNQVSLINQNTIDAKKKKVTTFEVAELQCEIAHQKETNEMLKERLFQAESAKLRQALEYDSVVRQNLLLQKKVEALRSRIEYVEGFSTQCFTEHGLDVPVFRNIPSTDEFGVLLAKDVENKDSTIVAPTNKPKPLASDFDDSSFDEFAVGVELFSSNPGRSPVMSRLRVAVEPSKSQILQKSAPEAVDWRDDPNQSKNNACDAADVNIDVIRELIDEDLENSRQRIVE